MVKSPGHAGQAGAGHGGNAGGHKPSHGQHIGFAALESKLAKRPGVTDPAALAASIGRKKYGNEGMAKMAAAGRKK